MSDDDRPEGWQTEKSGANSYSPAKFYCGSKDEQGHGTTYHVKIPDYMVPRMQSIAGVMPEYKNSVQNIFRDALRHRVEYLETHHAAVAECPERKMYDALEAAEVMAAKVKIFNSLPKKIAEACKLLKKAGAWDELANYLAEQKELALRCPKPWRGKILKALAEFVGLGPDDDDGDDEDDE